MTASDIQAYLVAIGPRDEATIRISAAEAARLSDEELAVLFGGALEA